MKEELFGWIQSTGSRWLLPTLTIDGGCTHLLEGAYTKPTVHSGTVTKQGETRAEGRFLK